MHSKPPGVATIAGACEVDRVIAKLVLAFGRQETTLFSFLLHGSYCRDALRGALQSFIDRKLLPSPKR